MTARPGTAIAPHPTSVIGGSQRYPQATLREAATRRGAARGRIPRRCGEAWRVRNRGGRHNASWAACRRVRRSRGTACRCLDCIPVRAEANEPAFSRRRTSSRSPALARIKVQTRTCETAYRADGAFQRAGRRSDGTPLNRRCEHRHGVPRRTATPVSGCEPACISLVFLGTPARCGLPDEGARIS